MERQFDIAVVGCGSLTGAAVLNLLQERGFPVGKLHALEIDSASGGMASFGHRELPIGSVEHFDFSTVQLAIFCAGAAVSAEYAPKAAVEGCVVIDNSTQFRLDPEVPLVVPEVNPEALKDYGRRGIVASPNCTTVPLLMALKPILAAAGLERIEVATYQSVSGAGQDALEELGRQSADLLSFREMKTSVFPKQIAFNLLPQIDTVEPGGYTREELRVIAETRRVFGEQVAVNVTAVRVPVFYGHALALHVQTREKLDIASVRSLLAAAPGLSLVEGPGPGDYPTPVTEASGEDAVFVGRLREDPSHPRGLNLWAVTDNIRKGGALNCVQIAELLIRDYL